MKFQLLTTNVLLIVLIQVIINIRADLFGRQWYDLVMLGVVSVWGLFAILNYYGTNNEDEDDG
jgi:hypothetical protein